MATWKFSTSHGEVLVEFFQENPLVLQKSPFNHSDKMSSKTNNSYKVWLVLLNVLHSLISFQIASHVMQIHKKLPTLKKWKIKH
jgi:hypothetical protein